MEEEEGGFIGLAYGAKKLYDLFKDRLDRYTPSVRKLLEQIGSRNIVSIDVCREPINSAISKVLNVISLGNWSKNAKALGYDSVFHLYMKVGLDDGNHYLVEKNQTIKIALFNKNVSEFISVPLLKKQMTLMEMLNKTQKFMGDHDYFVYSPSKLNCQNLLISFLSANALLTLELDRFILQPASKLLEGLPNFGQKLAQGVTDLARAASILVEGRGLC